MARVLAELLGARVIPTDASDADRILAVFACEGWKAGRVHNGPPHAGFGLVRGGSQMREQYERFFREATSRATPPRG